MAERIHIIGAGLAGLSAAVDLTRQGKTVCLYESTAQPGGRCRSYYDDTLGRTIDNGNHLMLSGNRALMEYLDRIGARDRLSEPDAACFDFYDPVAVERWSLNLGSGLLPLSLLKAKNRPPGSRLGDLASALKTRTASLDQSVEACLGQGGDARLYKRLWHPLATAVLNTDPHEAQAALLWPVLKQAFGRGGLSCHPLIAKDGLSNALIAPAIKYLQLHSVGVLFNHRLKSVESVDGSICTLNFSSGSIPVTPDDRVIFAVPPLVVEDLIDLKTVPNEFRPIINGHFSLPRKIDKLTIIGLINSISHWIFVHDAQRDVASITISAADAYMDLPSEDLAAQIWPEILAALDIESCPIGPYRIIREKRATIAQTPQQSALRPPCRVAGLRNLFLAGDWTDTGLPATIEGAIFSGKLAAESVLTRR